MEKTPLSETTRYLREMALLQYEGKPLAPYTGKLSDHPLWRTADQLQKNKNLTVTTATHNALREECDARMAAIRILKSVVDELEAKVADLRDGNEFTLVRELRDKITKLEDLFLKMYELGSADPQIEDEVEQAVACIVERQDG